MMTREPNVPLDFEQIEMLAKFSDYAADLPDLSFEQVAKKLGVDFTTAKNAAAWEKECRARLHPALAAALRDLPIPF
jgi:hypothetical protein